MILFVRGFHTNFSVPYSHDRGKIVFGIASERDVPIVIFEDIAYAPTEASTMSSYL